MKLRCTYCGSGERRPRQAKYRVRNAENERMSEQAACGYHLGAAVTENSGKAGFARVYPIPEEK